MYSSVLVGLMNCVASFSANGSRHTSQPARNPGSSSYALLAEVVDVRRARQRGRIDLHHRPDQDDLPVRPCSGERAEQLESRRSSMTPK